MGAANNSIEHRWSQRHKVSLPVDIFSSGIKLTSCVTRDVGLGGVFLEVTNDQPDREEEVDLIFSLGKERQVSKYKLCAKVVRTANDGVGLMFKDFDTGAFRSLQEIIRHTPDSSMNLYAHNKL